MENATHARAYDADGNVLAYLDKDQSAPAGTARLVYYGGTMEDEFVVGEAELG